jgi:SAM-dependent methyltransferase
VKKNHSYESFFPREYRRVLARYLNLIIPHNASVLEVGTSSGLLLNHLNASVKSGIDPDPRAVEIARENNPDAQIVVGSGESFRPVSVPDYVLISDTLNHVDDVQAVLENMRSFAIPETRLVITSYNTLWRPILGLASFLGLRASKGKEVQNWISRQDLWNLLELANWEVIKTEPRILCPVEIPILSSFLNRVMAPLLSPLCLSIIVIARPRGTREVRPTSVSVVIPARNEAGNIPAIVERTPRMGTWTELIFIEGNSSDNTWDAIQKIKADNPTLRIKIGQQPGKGKGDAVRMGYDMAEGDILMILDADMTVPPEDLPKFYNAIADDSCEFANGSRLVYPMEKKAMQFLNLCANKFFGVAFSWLLSQQVKDTLCGTKVLTKKNYLKIAANRSYFGDFDPFGDFDLLFGSDKLNLKIRDIPVRYRERTYGSTNINRWSHGALLFRMLGFAARKLKFT